MDKLKDFASKQGLKVAGYTSAALLAGFITYKLFKGKDPEYGGIDAHFAH
jgi:hypothetical protein